MIKHVTREEMTAFCALELAGRETVEVARHFHDCEECRRLFENTAQSQKFHRPLIFNFSPDSVRKDHLEYDDLVAYAEGDLVEAEAEELQAHCRECPRCDEDVRAFRSYLSEFDQYRNVRLGPRTFGERIKSYWDGRSAVADLKRHHVPAMVAVFLVVLTGVVLASLLFYSQRTEKTTGSPTTGSPKNEPSANNVSSSGAELSIGAANISSEGATTDRNSSTKTYNKAKSRRGEALFVLNDQGRRYGVDVQGKAWGTDGYPSELARDIQSAMRGNITKASSAAEVATTIVNNRGAENNHRVKLIRPSGTYVVTDQPILEWRPLAKDARYVVSIVDEDFNEMERSPETSATTYQVKRRLARGAVYRWQVQALKDSGELTTTYQHEVGKFGVISDAKLEGIKKAEESYESHLALGLIYKREGLFVEAEREFKQLLKANPKSEIVKKLLESVKPDAH